MRSAATTFSVCTGYMTDDVAVVGLVGEAVLQFPAALLVSKSRRRRRRAGCPWAPPRWTRRPCTCDTHVLYVGTSSIEVSGQLLMIFTKFTTISQCVQAKRIETSYLIYVNVDGLAESVVKSGLVRCAVSGVCPVPYGFCFYKHIGTCCGVHA